MADPLMGTQPMHMILQAGTVLISGAKGFMSAHIITSTMFLEYIQAAMDRATYEIIDNPEPFYGEVPELQSVWATGKTLGDCRRELQSVIEGWITLRIRFGHPIPPIGGCTIDVPTEPMTVIE